MQFLHESLFLFKYLRNTVGWRQHMIWHEKLYTSPSVTEKTNELIRKINAGETGTGAWLILLPSTDRNQLQILSAASVRRWYPHSFSNEASSSDTAGGEIPVVVGIAGSRTEAEEILVRMTEESLQIFGAPVPRRLFD